MKRDGEFFSPSSIAILIDKMFSRKKNYNISQKFQSIIEFKMRKCSIHYRLLIELKTLIGNGGANIFTATLRGTISLNKLVGSDYLWLTLTYRAPHSDIIN